MLCGVNDECRQMYVEGELNPPYAWESDSEKNVCIN